LLENGQVAETTKLYNSSQKKLYFGTKTKTKFNFQYIIGKSTLFATKIIIKHVFPFSSDIKKNNKKEKMILRDGEVARTFLEVFGFWLFLLLRFVLDKYVWYKVCTSDIALSNKKKFNWFRSWQYGLIESDICAKTFAPHVINFFLLIYKYITAI
jgi:hypothetical protein